MTGRSRKRRAAETRRSEPPEGSRACCNPDAGKEGGRSDEHACAHRCRSITIARNRREHSVSDRSAIRARALLATGSSTRSHRRAAFVFMLERGRRFRRQRSEQYRTSSHAALHFFLQLKGKPQVSHVFSGKCILLTMANHASRRILANCPVEQRCRRRYIGPSPLTVESARIVAQQLTAQRLCPRAWVEPDREECARERRVGHVGREAAVGVEACTALGHIHAAQHVAA